MVNNMGDVDVINDVGRVALVEEVGEVAVVDEVGWPLWCRRRRGVLVYVA